MSKLVTTAPSDNVTAAPYRPALDGLRCCAALFVLMAHGLGTNFKTEPGWPLIEYLGTIAGLGMTLFFVLSGFVIHHRYHDLWTTSRPGAIRGFVRARFARLYPLYLALLVYDLDAARRVPVNVPNVPEALLYYLPLAQAWRYVVLGGNCLIYQFGYYTSVTWSISVEVFFYTLYIVAVGALVRLRNMRGHVLVGVGLVALALSFVVVSHQHMDEINRWAVLRFGPIGGIEHGVQDSFFRWLVSFFPPARLAEFGVGCLAANWFRVTWRGAGVPDRERVARSAWWLVALVGAFVAVVALVPFVQSPVWLGPSSKVMGAPIAAAIVYLCCVDSSHPIARALGSSWMRKGGDASYGIYLLHTVVFHWYGTPTFPLGAAPVLLLSIKLVLMLVTVVVLARLVFVTFERPARSILRGQMRWSEWPGAIVEALRPRLALIGLLLCNELVLRFVERQIMARLG